MVEANKWVLAFPISSFIRKYFSVLRLKNLHQSYCPPGPEGVGWLVQMCVHQKLHAADENKPQMREEEEPNFYLVQIPGTGRMRKHSYVCVHIIKACQPEMWCGVWEINFNCHLVSGVITAIWKWVGYHVWGQVRWRFRPWIIQNKKAVCSGACCCNQSTKK